MKIETMKKFAFGLLVVAGIAVTGLSTVQAQDGRWDREERDRRERRRDDDWDGDKDRNRKRDDDRDRFGRNNRRGGWDDDDDRFGSNNGLRQRGFRDGFDQGREDARRRRRADPSNSSQYRRGNRVYQDGFRKGYFEAYRQFDNRGPFGNRRW